MNFNLPLFITIRQAQSTIAVDFDYNVNNITVYITNQYSFFFKYIKRMEDYSQYHDLKKYTFLNFEKPVPDNKEISLMPYKDIYDKLFTFDLYKLELIIEIINLSYQMITNPKYSKLLALLLKQYPSDAYKHINLRTSILISHIKRIYFIYNRRRGFDRIATRILNYKTGFLFKTVNAVYYKFSKNTQFILSMYSINKSQANINKTAIIWLLEIEYLSQLYDTAQRLVLNTAGSDFLPYNSFPIDDSTGLFHDKKKVVFITKGKHIYFNFLEYPSMDNFIYYPYFYKIQTDIDSEYTELICFDTILPLTEMVCCILRKFVNVYYDLLIAFSIINKCDIWFQIEKSDSFFNLSMIKLGDRYFINNILDYYKDVKDFTEDMNKEIPELIKQDKLHEFTTMANYMTYSFKKQKNESIGIYTRCLQYTCGHFAGLDLIKEYFEKSNGICFFCRQSTNVAKYFETFVYLVEEL